MVKDTDLIYEIFENNHNYAPFYTNILGDMQTTKYKDVNVLLLNMLLNQNLNLIKDQNIELKFKTSIDENDKYIICITNVPRYCFCADDDHIKNVHSSIKTSKEYIDFYKTDEIFIRISRCAFFDIKKQRCYISPYFTNSPKKDTLAYIMALFDCVDERYKRLSTMDISEELIRSNLAEAQKTRILNEINDIIVRNVKNRIDRQGTIVQDYLNNYNEAYKTFITLQLSMQKMQEQTQYVTDVGNYLISEVKENKLFNIDNIYKDGTRLIIDIKTNYIEQVFLDFIDLNKTYNNIIFNADLREIIKTMEEKEIKLVLSPIRVKFILDYNALLISDTNSDVLKVNFRENNNGNTYISTQKHALYYSGIDYHWYKGCLGNFGPILTSTSTDIKIDYKKNIKKFITVVSNYLKTTSCNGDAAGAHNLNYGLYVNKNNEIIYPKEYRGKTLNEYKSIE